MGIERGVSDSWIPALIAKADCLPGVILRFTMFRPLLLVLGASST